MVAKDPPSFYLEKLSAFMDPKASKILKKRKNQPCPSSTQVLRDLEISLRTNNIEWVREFLNQQNSGLDILIQYLGLANSELQKTLTSHHQSNNQNQYFDTHYGHLYRNMPRYTPPIDSTINNSPYLNGVSSNKSSNSEKSSPNHAQNGFTPHHSSPEIEGNLPENNRNSHNSVRKSHHSSGSGKDSKLNCNVDSISNCNHHSNHSSSVSPLNAIISSLVNLTSSNSNNTLPPHHSNQCTLFSEDPSNDVHLCIMCLRALMNNKYGFNQVISHKEAINYIALSLMHKNYRTKAQVLELLAAVCLVKGGHDIILAAFDYFKEVSKEQHRFQTLMHYFKNYTGDFNVDFMVACMQFINIVVHSVENMNYRVALQFAFTKIGLDDYLEKLKHTESDQLQVQISAYLDNVCDVSVLMQEAEIKNSALEQVADLQEQLENLNEKLVETENQAMARIVEMQTFLETITKEKDEIKKMYEKADYEASTLKKNFNDKESDYMQRQRELDQIMHEYLFLKEQLVHRDDPSSQPNAFLSPSSKSPNNNDFKNCNQFSVALPPPPPPPPPPLPFDGSISSHYNHIYNMNSGFINNLPTVANINNNLVNSKGNILQHHHHHAIVPNIPPIGKGLDNSSNPNNETMTIKRRIETKYRLPMLNWMPLKPRQLKGTIFNDLEDEALLNVIDFDTFEELFKLGLQKNDLSNPLNNSHPAREKDGNLNNIDCNGNNLISNVNGIMSYMGFGKNKGKDLNTVLESTRIRNLAITRRRLEMEDNEIMKAINNLDLKVLDLETVDILLRMLPTENEKKAYKTYESEGKPITKLTPEDKFLQQLCKVERLHNKLSIMSFMGNFHETVHLITPQIHSLIVASKSIRNSEKLKKIFEIILAFGNYLNSSRKGGVYGFKIQSLDTLTILKAPSNKETSLLHYIVHTINYHFPILLTFDTELRYIEKAVDASLENIMTDVHELTKGMEDTTKEYNARKSNPINPSTNSKETLLILEDFLSCSQDKLNKAKVEAKSAEESYYEVVEYFGETSKALPPNSFFPLFLRFIKQFKQAQCDNETKMEAKKIKNAGDNNNNSLHNGKSINNKSRLKNDQQGNNIIMSELKRKQNNNKIVITHNPNIAQKSVENGNFVSNGTNEKEISNENGINYSNHVASKTQLMSQDQVYHGALEDILTDLKKEPFRASDNIPRKSAIYMAR
ncbi:unnamed protein product [Gordionus sp. m RMFG-2023]